LRVSFYEAAQEYIRYCWSVFPVGRNKIPLTPHGRNDATCNEDKIREWSDQFPDANIAIATGKESGLLVIDVDDEEGAENFRKLKERINIPKSPIVKSARGWHLYFRSPGNCPCSQGRLGRHIDVRCVGGSITAPPSIHESGHEYYWIVPLSLPLPRLPVALYPLLYKPEVVIHRNPIKCEDIRVLADDVASAPKGERNATLNRAAFIAGRMVAEGKTTHDAAYRALYEAGRAAGLEHREVRATIKSGLKSGYGG
jgi:hypothetical protein